jgi:hypothetical protein
VEPVGDIFKPRFGEANDNLEQKVKEMTWSGLGLKRKRRPKKAQSQRKCIKIKDIFTEKKNY